MRSDAVEELFKAHYNDAYLYTLTITKNAQEAEDIVSVAFFRALNTADKKIRDFKPWLLRVCRNEIYTRSRKSKKVTALEGDVADEAESAVEKVIRDEEYRALPGEPSRNTPSFLLRGDEREGNSRYRRQNGSERPRRPLQRQRRIEKIIGGNI